MTDPFARIADFYGQRVAEHGYDVRACDYGNPHSQRVKFRVLSEVTDLAGLRLLDVGCGFADWADYLDAEVGGVHYTGIDLSPAMIDQASHRRPDLDLRAANVLDGSVTGPFDVVSANGIFYLLGDHAEALSRSIVTRMWDLCEVAVAFSTLSTWAADQEPGEYYADPLATVEFCRTLTPWVTLRHDYHHRDFAVYLYRNRRA